MCRGAEALARAKPKTVVERRAGASSRVVYGATGRVWLALASLAITGCAGPWNPAQLTPCLFYCAVTVQETAAPGAAYSAAPSAAVLVERAIK